MAQYWRDFESDTVGIAPPGFSRRWVTNGAAQVKSLASPPAGYTKGVEMLSVSASSRRLLSLDAVDADSDRATVKIATLTRFSNTENSRIHYGGVVARATGAASAETGLVGRIEGRSATAERLSIIYYQDGSGSITNTGDSDFVDQTQWHWVVAEFSGANITVLVYPENDPGGTALQTHSGTTSILSAGWVGLWFLSDISGAPEYAALSVATGADPLLYAPPSAASPPTLGNLQAFDITTTGFRPRIDLT